MRPGNGPAGDRHQHGQLLRADHPRVDRTRGECLADPDHHRRRGRHHRHDPRHRAHRPAHPQAPPAHRLPRGGAAPPPGAPPGFALTGRHNRRPLLLTGFTGVAAGHGVLGLSFLLPESEFRSYLILAAMLLVVFFVQTFIGTLVWLLLSEIFPMTIRGFAMGIAVFVLWTVNAAISFAFPPLVATLGATPTFGLFALINTGSIFFVAKFAPETRGRSLEELEDNFRTHDAGHFVH